jgi:hypothetical protein
MNVSAVDINDDLVAFGRMDGAQLDVDFYLRT